MAKSNIRRACHASCEESSESGCETKCSKCSTGFLTDNSTCEANCDGGINIRYGNTLSKTCNSCGDTDCAVCTEVLDANFGSIPN